MANTTPPKGPCARLFYERAERGAAGSAGMVDICRLRAGHQGDHEGQHRGVHWIDDPKTETGRRMTGYDVDRP